MTHFIYYQNANLSLSCIPVNKPCTFSLEATSELTGVHPEMLRYYAKLGLLGPAVEDPESTLVFDLEALSEIRRIGHYRRHLGVVRRALPLICELRREGERQHLGLHFLSYP